MHEDEYRKLAELEDRMWYFQALNRRIVETLAPLVAPGPARLLDAGCGTGGLIRALRAARAEWAVTGLDVSPRACALARERTSAEIVEGSAGALPFPDAHFDAVVSADVLCQLDHPVRALCEFRRVVRSGGAVVVNAPAFQWLWSYHDEACQSRQRFTRAELVGLFAAAGLEVSYASYANMLPLPLIAVRRKLLPPARPTSDLAVHAAPIEAAFAWMAAAEFAWMRRGGTLPIGSSVFLVGRRR